MSLHVFFLSVRGYVGAYAYSQIIVLVSGSGCL